MGQSEFLAPPRHLDTPLRLDPVTWSPKDVYRLHTALIAPRPIAWVSTRSAEGVDNLAPHSYRAGTSECENPNMNRNIISDIVTFWLSDSRDCPARALARRDWWYDGGTTVDEEIRVRFGDLVPRACAREFTDWRDTPDGALALILLLDQFTRNLYRGTVEAYAGDPTAFEVVNHAIDRRLDRELHPVATIWLYHPFHHSEDVTEQDRGLELLRALRKRATPAWQAYVERSIKGWTSHRDIVARFGRFPHRNAVLGRPGTTEEAAFLAAEGNSFGQRLPVDNTTC